MYVWLGFMSLIKVLVNRLKKILRLVDLVEDEDGQLRVNKLKSPYGDIDLFAPTSKNDSDTIVGDTPSGIPSINEYEDRL